MCLVVYRHIAMAIEIAVHEVHAFVVSVKMLYIIVVVNGHVMANY